MIQRIPIRPLRDWIDQNTHLLLRSTVVAAVLLVTLFIARRPSPLYLGLLAGLGAFLVLMRRPVLGLAGIIIGGLVVPVGIGTGSESELNPPMLIIIVLVALRSLDVIRRHEIKLMPSRTNLPLIVLLVGALLSLGVGQLNWFMTSGAPIRAQLGGLAIYVLSVAVFFLTRYLVREQSWLERLVWIFLALGAVYIAGRIVGPIGEVTGRLFTTSSAGSLFWTWLVALSFSQAVYNKRLRPFWRASLLFLTGAVLFVGMTRDLGWTSGWAPAVAAIGVILLVGSPRLGIVLVVIGVIGFLVIPQLGPDLFSVGDNSYSALTRVAAWRILLQIVEVSPILGLGPANYYFYTPLFSILGYYVRFNSHNNYVDLVAQLGVVGLACFLWFCAETGIVGWRLRRVVEDGFSRAYVYAELGGLAGMLVAAMFGDWVLPFVYNIGLAGFRASVLGWLFLGGLAALEQIYRAGNAQPEVQAQSTARPAVLPIGNE